MRGPNMKTIILYYSRTRKTALVSKILAEKVDADLIEIRDVTKRTGVVNYLKSSIDALREKKTRIEPEKIDLDDYGLIYIGSPTWASKPVPAIVTLIDSLNLHGKDVIPFTTMGSRGGGNVVMRMREKIEARGGRAVNTLIFKTGNLSNEDIKESVERTVQDMDLTIYGI
jgi:flavodoxin